MYPRTNSQFGKTDSYPNANYLGDMIEIAPRTKIVMCESAPHEEHYFDYPDSDYSDYHDCGDPCNGGRS